MKEHPNIATGVPVGQQGYVQPRGQVGPVGQQGYVQPHGQVGPIGDQQGYVQPRGQVGPVGQQGYVQPHGQAGQFSTGLCVCCSGASSTPTSPLTLWCMTCFCPCITFGRIAEIVDRGTTSFLMNAALYTLIGSFTGCQWAYSCTYRSKLRALYGMEDNNCGDCCVHFCCEHCALRQEYRELELRGYNLALGWHGNMERQNPGMVQPPMAGGMNR